MTGAWPDSVERVAAFLRAAGAEARLEQLGEDATTAAAAAEAIGCEPGQVVEIHVLVCGTRTAVALVPGDRRCDLQKVARSVGAVRARPARPEEAERATGCAPGAVAPFPPAAVDAILLERTLLSQPVVWVGAGSARHLVRLEPTELVRLTRAATVDVVQEGEAVR